MQSLILTKFPYLRSNGAGKLIQQVRFRLSSQRKFAQSFGPFFPCLRIETAVSKYLPRFGKRGPIMLTNAFTVLPWKPAGELKNLCKDCFPRGAKQSSL
uniref:Uncharacterized protein n=1 Tax=Rhizophora mucronata TaxID=61149 RepID=A0A2P2N4W4_RHIMU